MVALHWHTEGVDARLQTAPPVIATYELLHDGSIRDLQLLQGSGNQALDNSVRRAILDSTFPPIPSYCDKDHAGVEFTFELKR
jgi:TonB family protein